MPQRSGMLRLLMCMPIKSTLLKIYKRRSRPTTHYPEKIFGDKGPNLKIRSLSQARASHTSKKMLSDAMRSSTLVLDATRAVKARRDDKCYDDVG